MVEAEAMAIVWQGEDGTVRRLSRGALRDAVHAAAGGLKAIGCVRGDVVGLSLPMLPETVIAYLAVLSLGAIALPLFSGFGAHPAAHQPGGLRHARCQAR